MPRRLVPRPSVAPRPDSGRATLSRSVTLLRAFRQEQVRPDLFYRPLAEDSVRQMLAFFPLAGRTVADIGGGSGWFADAFAQSGARYVCIDPDVGESDTSFVGARVRGSGLALPLRDGSVDVAYSSNVAEHVPQPAVLLREMLRVTRPGGHVVLSYTSWWSPWGGHETSPWHYLGGRYARRRFERRRGRPPKNRFGESLFAWTVRDGLAWVTESRDRGECTVLAVRPRYHPAWAWWVVRVPVLREIVTWNLYVVLQRT